jgi:hypothetical protein
LGEGGFYFGELGEFKIQNSKLEIQNGEWSSSGWSELV